MRQLPVLLILWCVSCTHAPARVATTQGQALTHRFVSGDGEEAEEAPEALGQEVAEDQARIVSQGEEEICVEFLLQTEAIYARTMEQLGPMCLMGAEQVAGEIRPGESASVAELWYEEFMITSFGWVSRFFRVETRQATVCCPRGTGETLEIVLRNEAMGTPAYLWQGRWTGL